MRTSLLYKYCCCFFLVFLSLFILLNTYGSNQIKTNLVNQKKIALYQESESICNQYVQEYYANSITKSFLYKQLVTVGSLTNTRIWMTDHEGTLLLDTEDSMSGVTTNVLAIDPSILNSNTKSGVKYPGYFDTPMIMAESNIIVNYNTVGYIFVFMSEDKVLEDTIQITNVINTLLLYFMVTLIILIVCMYLFSIRPLHKLIKAAKEYSLGHFDASISLRGNDEFNDLANTINFMATELNSIDEYQKNFIANISHDFRSPLTSIKGYAEAILDGTIPYEMQNKYIDIIVFETERLNKLTNNLLTLNTFERNGSMLNITSFDINSVIKKTVSTFEGTCTKKKITINLEFSSEELFVDADMDKIQQVFYNLIDNAIKFSHHNSSIRILINERNNKAFISIKDYGIGIPKDSLKKIWERFYKTDLSRGKDKKGTGLGLSITKEIINAHNENITVISTEGAGTEFTFSLPLSDI
ncbi:MAG: HAMP domain-containing sensor histidine kinase [bacterium]|nr:HAMP domain-containing sensor histidine kinase [bacterium]